ncbi:carbonic anhydrase 4-like [Sardina pilchardus]|uniref:carbonic anhydrase 4-like n=1 Tax=Sardina pilchardus TaxID=27697 RepID=UPI002E0F9882
MNACQFASISYSIPRTDRYTVGDLTSPYLGFHLIERLILSKNGRIGLGKPTVYTGMSPENLPLWLFLRLSITGHRHLPGRFSHCSTKMWSSCLISVLVCLLPVTFGDDPSVAWCYNEPTCNDTTWPRIAPDFCSVCQSPIDIVSASAVPDSSLGGFTLAGFDDKTAFTKIQNTGKTVKIELASGAMNVSGGSLPTDYSSLQFHLHWGDGSSVPGSEHTVDGKRYPMELHIVNAKTSLNGNLTEILADSEGLAALGFFIEVESGTTDQPASWKSLADHLANITENGEGGTL